MVRAADRERGAKPDAALKLPSDPKRSAVRRVEVCGAAGLISATTPRCAHERRDPRWHQLDDADPRRRTPVIRRRLPVAAPASTSLHPCSNNALFGWRPTCRPVRVPLDRRRDALKRQREPLPAARDTHASGRHGYGNVNWVPQVSLVWNPEAKNGMHDTAYVIMKFLGSWKQRHPRPPSHPC